MVLTIEERKLFFKNWLNLLAFVNAKYSIISDFGYPDNPVGINIDNIIKIKNRLWKNRSLINEYLEANELNEDDHNLINSWNNFINRKFIIIKELSHYCVFLESKKNVLYGVHGISQRFSNLAPAFPIMVETVLIPFKDKIIYDSIISQDNITFGSNIKKSLNEEYKAIKEKDGIKVKL
jgi:hypothetical protein